MKNKDITVWGIHAGRVSEASSLFLRSNIVAIGWDNLGDLSTLKPNRDAFKAKVAEGYPDRKPAAIANTAGQLFRFVHEIKLGDLVAFPNKVDRKIYIGEITGDYVYESNSKKSLGYSNQRSVKWLKVLPRTEFSQGALYEMGSAMSLFQIKNYVDEIFAALEGNLETKATESDATVAAVAEEIEQNTRDFILKQLAKELKGHPFAEFVAHLLETMGYRTRVSPEGPDGGIDIIAHKDELGFEPPIVKVQVKSSEGSVGDPVVSALYGKVDNGEYGLIVTLGNFTNPAKRFADGKSNLRLVDGEELVDLVLQHYEQFDSRYKGFLPLKQVYVPEPLDKEE
jgi:restriction system protein